MMATEMIVIFHHDERGVVRTWSEVGTLVRCKDCKHNSLNRVSGNVFCSLGIGLSQIYDFCSYGERK